MASRDFNTFMDSYIHEIRTNKKRSVPVSREAEEESVPSDLTAHAIYIIKKPKTFFQQLIERFFGTNEEDFVEHKKTEKKASVQDEQEFDQEYEELAEKQGGFMGWLKSIFATDVNESYQDIDDEERLEREAAEPQRTQPTPVAKKSVPKVITKQSWWSRLFGDSSDYEEDMEQAIPEQAVSEISQVQEQQFKELKQDMKEVAIIATAAFKKLPKDQFGMFKNSSDFKRFKEILAKHDIIKK